MAIKAYLTEAQAKAIIGGGANEAATYTRTQVQVFGWRKASDADAFTGWMVRIADGEFEGWLASTRSPHQPREFSTLDAAHRTAARLLSEVMPGADAYSVEVCV